MAVAGFLGRVADKVSSVLHPGQVTLNDGEWTGETRPALAISESLQKMCLALQGTFIREDGSGVNYREIGQSDMFKEYVKSTAELRHAVISTLTPVEKKAFFMNTYNMLTIHALVTQGPDVKSVRDIPRFWRRFGYEIAGHYFSLDDMEHGILRANRPHPATQTPLFSSGDPRLEFSLKDEEVDPRIHFALVCGSKSCPPIRVYSARNFEFGLSGAAKNFCNNEVTVEGHKVIMSKIFDWYGHDFGNTKEALLRRILTFLGDDSPVKEPLTKLVDSGSFDISFKTYDWSLNHG
eukprot:m.88327 g.88327  ORF g.88327 m.88327 type:complete len:293 (+) comp15178_c0_seq1:190-1068(+)